MIRQGWTTKEKLEKEASDNEKILKITRADSKTKWAVIFMLLGMVLVPFGDLGGRHGEDPRKLSPAGAYFLYGSARLNTSVSCHSL